MQGIIQWPSFLNVFYLPCILFTSEFMSDAIIISYLFFNFSMSLLKYFHVFYMISPSYISSLYAHQSFVQYASSLVDIHGKYTFITATLSYEMIRIQLIIHIPWLSISWVLEVIILFMIIVSSPPLTCNFCSWSILIVGTWDKNSIQYFSSICSIFVKFCISMGFYLSILFFFIHMMSNSLVLLSRCCNMLLIWIASEFSFNDSILHSFLSFYSLSIVGSFVFIQ